MKKNAVKWSVNPKTHSSPRQLHHRCRVLKPQSLANRAASARRGSGSAHWVLLETALGDTMGAGCHKKKKGMHSFSVEEAEAKTGIQQCQVSRWRTVLRRHALL